MFSPDAIRACADPRERDRAGKVRLRGFGQRQGTSDERFRTLGRQLNPFPLRRCPHQRLVDPWSVGAILHEVSNKVQNELKLEYAVALLRGKLLTAVAAAQFWFDRHFRPLTCSSASSSRNDHNGRSVTSVVQPDQLDASGAVVQGPAELPEMAR